MRNLKKKLEQIERLEKKKESEKELTEEERIKISKKEEFIKQLEELNLNDDN